MSTQTPSEPEKAAQALEQHIGPSFRLLESVSERVPSDELDTLKRNLGVACEHFPYLGPKTVTVGVRQNPGAEHSRFTPYASAEPINYFIRLPVESTPSNQVLFHELAHLEIYERDRFTAELPTTSEEFCSIYAVARMPKDMLFRSDIAYLGTPSAPQDEWPSICRRALEYRESNRDYIKQCKEWLEI